MRIGSQGKGGDTSKGLAVCNLRRAKLDNPHHNIG